jgi:hypothetical protein
LNRKQGQSTDPEEELERLRALHKKPSKVGKMPDYLNNHHDEDSHGNENYNYNQFGGIEEKRDVNRKQNVNLGGIANNKEYVSG